MVCTHYTEVVEKGMEAEQKSTLLPSSLTGIRTTATAFSSTRPCGTCSAAVSQ